jgi:hypothetical protein
MEPMANEKGKPAKIASGVGLARANASAAQHDLQNLDLVPPGRL